MVLATEMMILKHLMMILKETWTLMNTMQLCMN